MPESDVGAADFLVALALVTGCAWRVTPGWGAELWQPQGDGSWLRVVISDEAYYEHRVP